MPILGRGEKLRTSVQEMNNFVELRSQGWVLILAHGNELLAASIRFTLNSVFTFCWRRGVVGVSNQVGFFLDKKEREGSRSYHPTNNT